MDFARKMALVSVALLTATAGSQAGLLEFGQYGQAASGNSSAGMGLVAAVAGLGDPVLDNPALLSGRMGIRAQATATVGWTQEKRTREVFDSYSNSVGLNTDLLHSYFAHRIKSVSAGYALSPAGWPRLGVGLGLAREYDFGYQSHREVRDGFYYLTEVHDSVGSGQINRFTLALSCQPLARLSAGIGFSRLQGHQEIRTEIVSYDPATPSRSSSATRYFKGGRIEAGLWGLVSRRLAIGLTANTGAKLTGTAWSRRGELYTDTSSSVTYPAGYTLGLSYHPSSDFPATVSLEYAYTPWHRLKDNLNPHHRLQAVNSYRLSIEHRLSGNLPLRFGLAFANSYLNRGIGLAKAGLGTEVPAGPVSVAVGANVGRRSYNLGQALSVSDPTTVTESVAELMITVSLR
jgi:hypothetical protein